MALDYKGLSSIITDNVNTVAVDINDLTWERAIYLIFPPNMYPRSRLLSMYQDSLISDIIEKLSGKTLGMYLKKTQVLTENAEDIVLQNRERISQFVDINGIDASNRQDFLNVFNIEEIDVPVREIDGDDSVHIVHFPKYLLEISGVFTYEDVDKFATYVEYMTKRYDIIDLLSPVSVTTYRGNNPDTSAIEIMRSSLDVNCEYVRNIVRYGKWVVTGGLSYMNSLQELHGTTDLCKLTDSTNYHLNIVIRNEHGVTIRTFHSSSIAVTPSEIEFLMDFMIAFNLAVCDGRDFKLLY
jgi:hypothetical protein